MHIRDINSRVLAGVGEAKDVSFLASLTPSLILYPAGTELGDQIKALCRDHNIPYRAITDDDPDVVTLFVGFNLSPEELLRFIGIFKLAKPYIVNNM